MQQISKNIVRFGIQAWNLAQIPSKGHYFGKKVLATQKFNLAAILQDGHHCYLVLIISVIQTVIQA